MDDARAIAEIVLRQPSVWITAVCAAAVLIPLSTWVAVRVGWSHPRIVAVMLSAASVALVVGVTLGRGSVHWTLTRPCLMQPGLSLGSPEAKLNVVLLAPAAFFGVLAARRPVRILAAAVALSAAIEALQKVTGLGVCQSSDVTRNVAGALVGLLAGWLVQRAGAGAGNLMRGRVASAPAGRPG